MHYLTAKKSLGSFKVYTVAWDGMNRKIYIMQSDMFDSFRDKALMADETGSFTAANIKDARRAFIKYLQINTENSIITYGF
jgi:ribosomal protein L16/L10AE